MKKADLIEAVAAKSGLTKADAGKAIDATVDAITDALASGDKVALVGFGTFSVSDRNARTGKNPQTGAAIQIAACKAPKFKPGQGLKEAVNS